MKCLKEFINEINDEQLGKLIRYGYEYENNKKEINKDEPQILKFLFNYYIKKEIDKKIRTSKKRSVCGKLGGRGNKK